MIAPAWQRRLDSATSPPEVLAVARQFVETFTAAEIDRLPEVCRPGSLDAAREISELAQCLSHHFYDGDAATARLLTRMAQFFSAAAIRLSEVAAAARPLERDDA